MLSKMSVRAILFVAISGAACGGPIGPDDSGVSTVDSAIDQVFGSLELGAPRDQIKADFLA